MGGSDSRCCVDSEENALKECTTGYQPPSNLQSPSQNTSGKIVRMDPRSPSSRVDRTPILVSGTPSGQPKPLMRVQPMIEKELFEGFVDNNKPVHANKTFGTEQAALLDPRSPAAPGSRTPINLKSMSYDVMQDPRSPTLGIVRTPLLGESGTEQHGKGIGLKENKSSCDWAICQTPQKHVYAMTDDSKTAGETFHGVFDPRSPTEGIDRTPLGKSQDHDNVFSPNSANGGIDLKSKVMTNSNDPRSPSEGIQRTPVGRIYDQSNVSTSMKCADDPHSTNAEIPRTPLGGLFSGRRELRRTVLLSNALMASPLTKKITHSSANTSQSVDTELNQAECTGNLIFLDLPNRNLRNFDESRSSSVVAVLGSDVDSLSNLDESIGEDKESSHVNVVDVSQDEGMEYDCIPGKLKLSQDNDYPNKILHTDQVNVATMADHPCNMQLEIPTCHSSAHRTTTLASERSSSVDASERFVTAKFSALSTDEEYQSSQEVNEHEHARPLRSEASSSCEVVSPSSGESMPGSINFVTTYEILDDESDTCALTDSAKSGRSEVQVNANKDNYITLDKTTNTHDDSTAARAVASQSGDDDYVSPDTTSSLFANSNSASDTEANGCSQVEETHHEKACGGANAQSYSAAEHDSSESSANRGEFERISDKDLKSDSELQKLKSTPTSENRKKPKRRLRTPKAVTRKQRHLSSSSYTVSARNFRLESTKPKSLSNTQLSHVGMSFGRNAQTPSDVLDDHGTAATRSPLATLTNDFGKLRSEKARKNCTMQSATKLPRYRGTPKTSSKSLTRSFGERSANRKTVGNKEN